MPDGMMVSGETWRKLTGGDRHSSLSPDLKILLGERQAWRCCGCGEPIGLKRDMEQADRPLERLAIFVPRGNRFQPHDEGTVVLSCEECRPTVKAEWACVEAGSI